MTAPSEVIRKNLSSLVPGDGMLRIRTRGDDTITISRRHGGWNVGFKDVRLSGALFFVTDGPALDLILTDTDTAVSQKLSLLSASVGSVSFWDGKQGNVLWEARP